MVDFVIDHIPMWMWFIIVGVPVGALLYFFGPILMPIWRMLPLPVRVALVGVGVAFLAFMGGRYKGRANAEEEERRRDAQSLQRRTEVNHDVDMLSDKQTKDRIDKRWSRD